jgi:opacity protein-like surface antigen
MKNARIALSIISAVVCTFAHAETTNITSPNKIYVGIFGGIASPNDVDTNQYGTAFYTEDLGGPLAVNALGSSSASSVGLFGGKIGFQWMDIPLSSQNSDWGLAPAIELEGYGLGRNTYTAHLSNYTTRLPQHNFTNKYPTKINVFLTNAVINLNSCHLGAFHPYVGLGIGGAFTRISNATATQIAPPELDVNHYNGNPSDHDSAFAGQAKLGVNMSLTQNISVFLEYQYLYLSSTSYVFGSTVYPTHPETSSWQVKMDPQHFNTGTLGVQFSI